MPADAALTHNARILLLLMDNRSGRAGWLLREESAYEPIAAELVEAGLAVRKRLGGFPGLLVTEAGRARIMEERR